MMSKGPFRADHVGSFLRPQRLKDARDKQAKGEIAADALRAVEDECILEVIAMQERVGLQAITDGEFRRASFHTHFLLQLDGVEMPPARFPTGAAGTTPRQTIPAIQTTKKLKRTHGIATDEFKFVAAHTKRTPKITIPSPSMLHFRGGREAISREAYPDLEGFYADVTRVWREEVPISPRSAAVMSRWTTPTLHICAIPSTARGPRSAAKTPMRYAPLRQDDHRGLCRPARRYGRDHSSLPRQFPKHLDGRGWLRPGRRGDVPGDRHRRLLSGI